VIDRHGVITPSERRSACGERSPTHFPNAELKLGASPATPEAWRGRSIMEPSDGSHEFSDRFIEDLARNSERLEVTVCRVARMLANRPGRSRMHAKLILAPRQWAQCRTIGHQQHYRLDRHKGQRFNSSDGILDEPEALEKSPRGVPSGPRAAQGRSAGLRAFACATYNRLRLAVHGPRSGGRRQSGNLRFSWFPYYAPMGPTAGASSPTRTATASGW